MKPETKEFLEKLTILMREYNATIEIECDMYSGYAQIVLEVKNPQTFDEHYDEWVVQNPGSKYPIGSDEYSYADWVDIGCRIIDAKSLEEILK